MKSIGIAAVFVLFCACNGSGGSACGEPDTPLADQVTVSDTVSTEAGPSDVKTTSETKDTVVKPEVSPDMAQDIGPVDVCLPDCGACDECGDDGCGGSCGSCDDGNDCTLDTCVDKQCVHSATDVAGCCDVTADCEDGNPCTEHFCAEHICIHWPPFPGCCVSDDDCGQSTPCLTLWCEDGWCHSEEKTPAQQEAEGIECCTEHQDCATGDPGSQDYCIQGLCVHANPPDGCDCDSGVDCGDGNPCTADVCHGGCICINEWNYNCCLEDGDCDDGNACTDDVCDLEEHKCLFPIKECCCVDNADCSSGDFCTYAICMPDLCCGYFPVEGCCLTDEECDDCDPCTEDACINNGCRNVNMYCND